MLGFLIGAACLLGLIKVARFGRRGRWAHGGGCGHRGYGRCGGHDSYGGGPDWGSDERSGWGGGRSFFLRSVFRRLDTTPGQEKVIASALDELRATADKVRGDVKSARPELANAIRQEQFDETLFGELSHKIDEAAQTMRRAVVDAFAKIHSVLDERQKKDLADLVERGGGLGGGFGRWTGGGRGRWGGPYRGTANI